MLDTPVMLVELSVMEQRYQAVSFVVHDGESVVEVARRFNVWDCPDVNQALGRPLPLPGIAVAGSVYRPGAQLPRSI